MTTDFNPDTDGSETADLDVDGSKKPEPKRFHIQIDRAQFEVSDEKLTGAELRCLPPTPIPPERDLFQIVPGHPDLKIKDDDTVEIQDGLRFFTAPSTINPGISLTGCGTTKCLT